MQTTIPGRATMADPADFSTHEAMTRYERRKAEEAWTELPSNPGFVDFLRPVGEYDVPAYVNFPAQRRRFAERRAKFLEAVYPLSDSEAFALAARQANCNPTWIAEELGVTRATVGSYFESAHNKLGRALLTENVPPETIEEPLVIDIGQVRTCPECGTDSVLTLKAAGRVFPDPAPPFAGAIQAAGENEQKYICTSCHSALNDAESAGEQDAPNRRWP